MKETVGVVNMTDANGSEVTGALLIKTNGPDFVIIAGKIWNLPVGEHPIHVHESWQVQGQTYNDSWFSGINFAHLGAIHK